MEEAEVDVTTVLDVDKKAICIVRFGPDVSNSGFRPAEYFQVVVDPDKVSPSGKYIRFGYYADTDEINGWQKAECIFVVEKLEEI